MSTDYFDDVGAYLLGALEPDELAAFEAELDRNADLRADVARLKVAADALPASPTQIQPPAHLKARIMAVVESEAQLLAAAGPEADHPRKRRRVVAVLRPGWWSLRPGLAVAASVLVLAIGAGISALALDGSGEIRTRVQNAELIQRESGHSTLTATNLEPPGAGHVYQVWLQHAGGEPKPTNALFSARRDGTASVDVPGDLDDVETVMVTIEPEGGSMSPTGSPVLEIHPA